MSAGAVMTEATERQHILEATPEQLS